MSGRRTDSCASGGLENVCRLRRVVVSPETRFHDVPEPAARDERGSAHSVMVRFAPDASRSMGFLPDTSFMRRIPKQRRPPSLQGVPRTRFVAMDAARSSSVATSNTDERTGLTP
jgi:hypothetical protein